MQNFRDVPLPARGLASPLRPAMPIVSSIAFERRFSPDVPAPVVVAGIPARAATRFSTKEKVMDETIAGDVLFGAKEIADFCTDLGLRMTATKVYHWRDAGKAPIPFIGLSNSVPYHLSTASARSAIGQLHEAPL